MMVYCRADVGQDETSLNEADVLGETETMRADNRKDSDVTNRLQDDAVVKLTPWTEVVPFRERVRSFLYTTWSSH